MTTPIPPPQAEDLRQEAIRNLNKRRGFYRHLLAYVMVNAFLIVIWAMVGMGLFWPVFPLFAWGIGLAFHAVDVFAPSRPSEKDIRSEMDRLHRT